MANIEIKYAKVWEVKEENGVTKINLGDSKKNKDGTYTNWTWFGCALFGNAKGMNVQKDDKIHAKGQISMYKGNDGKYYQNIALFDIEFVEKKEETSFMSLDEDLMAGFAAIEDDDFIPF